MKNLRDSITTLLFDWDGTLFDSSRAGRLAFQKTFDDLGIPFTQEFYEARYSPNWYAICGNEHIVNKKPHPEGLEKVMRLMSATPEASSYVGDAPEDVQMGKNAQELTVAVRSAYPISRHLIKEQPDIHLESIDELLRHFS